MEHHRLPPSDSTSSMTPHPSPSALPVDAIADTDDGTATFFKYFASCIRGEIALLTFLMFYRENQYD